MPFTLLIADDEKNIRIGLGKSFEMEGYNVILSEDGEDALHQIERHPIDLVISDLRMPKLSGEELLRKIRISYPTIPVIILTGHGTVENAVNAMRDGAYDFVTKPINMDRLYLLAKRALSTRSLTMEHKALRDEVEKLKSKRDYSAMIGKSTPMQKVFDLINQVADSKASVLITGDSGVGKEMVADALHALSGRSKSPLIKVHCAALSESLLESELFGHEKGAFTGAVSSKKGRFELADGGTLFLDEIGEIDSTLQVKLLRVLQERTFERVGSGESIKTDIRLITATNRDLKEEIAQGNFREDLFYRLNVVNIHIPPLRERKDDIPLLVASFIKEFSEDNNRDIRGIDPKASAALYKYAWPGNIRELRNCLESAVVLCRGSVITTEDLPPQVVENNNRDYLQIEMGTSLAAAEKAILRGTLHYFNGNKTKASEILQIGRKTLHRKLYDYGLDEEFIKSNTAQKQTEEN